MLIGHLATYRALEQATTGLSVRELVAADFEWQPEGWATVCSYRRPGDDRGPRSLNVCLHLRDSRRPPHTLTASVDPAGGATARARHRPHHRLTAAAGPQSRWNATIAPVQLDMTRHDSARLFAKPFAATPGFNPVWWTYGDVRGPLAWCSVTDPDLGEIARAQIKLRSVVGEAYPTRPIPRGGATEIDLIEVRADLRGRGLGIGRSVLALIKEAFAGPYVALSLDEGSDGFWRRIGWAEHDHPDADEARACGAGVPAVLFETS